MDLLHLKPKKASGVSRSSDLGDFLKNWNLDSTTQKKTSIAPLFEGIPLG